MTSGRGRCRAIPARAAVAAAALTILSCTAAMAQAPDVRLAPPSSRLYGGLEYLLWSAKAVRLAVPLLSTGTGDPNSEEGFLRSSQSSVLYGAPHAPAQGGKSEQALPWLNGGRITLGYWLDDARSTAVEVSETWLQQRSNGYQFHTDANGSPGARIPLYNNSTYLAGGPGGTPVPPLEDGVPVGVPGAVSGAASFKNALQLWGADASGVVTLYRDQSLELSGLAGLRYLKVTERFHLQLNIGGVPGTIYTTEYGSASDSFKTENQFLGGQLGFHGRYTVGRLSAELTTKLGIGLSHESESISGAFQEFNTPVLTSLPFMPTGQRAAFGGPYGIYAQPSNEGHRSTDKFAVAPEIEVKLGYDLTESIRMTAGYDFLYYSSVLRPTDQIDRSFSKGLPFLQDPNSTTGPTRKFRTTDFYAQGLTLGVTFKF